MSQTFFACDFARAAASRKRMRFFVLLEDFDETMAARLALGDGARTMSDQEIVDRWNQHVLALAHGFDETSLTLARLGHLLRRRGAHFCLICGDR